MQISLTNLRRTPAQALGAVRAGEEVIVTDAGVPFMRMVPVGKPTKYESLLASVVLRTPIEPHDIADVRAKSLDAWRSPT